MILKLLTEHHLEFLSLKGGCTGSSESTLVKKSNCWKSNAAAHYIERPQHIPVILSLKSVFVSANSEGLDEITHLVLEINMLYFSYRPDY